MKKLKKISHKVQSNVEDYTLFVVEGLISIKGTSTSDVVSYMLKSWIENNDGLLEGYGLSVKDWRAAKKET